MARASYAIRIRSRIQELEADIAEKRKELDELRIAERVLNRLTVDDGSETDEPRPTTQTTKEPTIQAQIVEVLRTRGPLETQAVVEGVSALRAQPTSPGTVQSTLSRMKAANLIAQTGGKWHVVVDLDSTHAVPQTNEAPGGAPNIFE